MMKSLMLLVVSLCAITLATAANNDDDSQVSFKGYKLVLVKPETIAQVDALAQWSQNQDFDMWTELTRIPSPATVMLSSEAFAKYKRYMSLLNMNYEIMNNDVDSMIEEQKRSMMSNRESKRAVEKYLTYQEIEQFLDDTVKQNPSIASSYVAGLTYEKRNLKVLVLKAPAFQSKSIQSKVWIDCGIHAREWISPATCVWIIDSLVSEYNTNAANSLISQFEFHILPLVNPDGYAYTWSNNRMWRKNRRPSSALCTGTDLNRNFGFFWNTGGSSGSGCSDTYHGGSADSELETKAIQQAILKHKGEWSTYLTLHSYGLYWFTNWGYTTSLPSNYNQVYAKGKIGADALKAVSGTTYTIGSSAKILYVASGGSEDWAHGSAGVPYAYCLELRPGQSQSDYRDGFMLKEARIPDSGKETFVGIKALLNSIRN